MSVVFSGCFGCFPVCLGADMVAGVVCLRGVSLWCEGAFGLLMWFSGGVACRLTC